MFGHPAFPSSSSEFLSVDSRTSPEVMSPLNFPLCPLTQLTVAESFDSVSEAVHSGSSSGSYNSPRSVSSHSLQKNGLHCHFASSINEFIDSDYGPLRRIFSTGELDQGHHSHRRSESPLSISNESNAIIEGMSRACRYSPEEKKDRIQRYRTKRNLRNFNKKIKYACRKALADTRPRIRGRFARNEEGENNPRVEWSHIGENEEVEEENWINFLDSLSANLYNP